MITVSCAIADTTVIDTQQKLLARKYVEKSEYFFQFYDGTLLKVDQSTYHNFRERETVQLTWRKKNARI
jgi:hypothetical protein